ncbi:MAG: hypothetical protein JSU95_08175 [Betaproteobacteria bacterium]|nr:MAG: hypothetical protein JSU95_08175 [Betaproteobacteria bacterium]
MKHTVAMLVVLLGVSGLLSNAAAEIEIKKQQGTRYVTGGMTEEENKQMGKLADRFPLHIVLLVAGRDEPVQGVDVTVRDIRGTVLLQAKSEGPLFFVDVVGGRYTVDAEYAGEKQSQTKDLTGRRYLRLRFTFNE